jgi:hypothetical protein
MISDSICLFCRFVLKRVDLYWHFKIGEISAQAALKTDTHRSTGSNRIERYRLVI